MPKFRKFTKVFRWKKRNSNVNKLQTSLRKGSFKPLDVIRIKKNSLNSAEDMTSNLVVEKKSKVVIDETDSEPDEIDFFEEDDVNLDDEGLHLQKVFEKKSNSDGSIFEIIDDDSLDEVTSTDNRKEEEKPCLNIKVQEDPEINNKINSSLKNFKYNTSIKEKQKLGNIIIKTRYDVLPQHKVESTAGTRSLTGMEETEFKKHALLKRGIFDASEDNKIKNNWKIFCEDNDWDVNNPTPFLFMKPKNKEFLMHDLENRKRFLRCLAHGLPDRSLFSVNCRFRILFDPHKTDKYTEEEDKTILQYMSKKTSDKKEREFADLAAILNRTRGSVWRRYHGVLKKKI